MSSLGEFIEGLPPEQILTVTEPVDADCFSTALAHEPERQKRYPVIVIRQPTGLDIPIVANLFADERRRASVGGISVEQFRHDPWFLKGRRTRFLPGWSTMDRSAR